MAITKTDALNLNLLKETTDLVAGTRIMFQENYEVDLSVQGELVHFLHNVFNST